MLEIMININRWKKCIVHQEKLAAIFRIQCNQPWLSWPLTGCVSLGQVYVSLCLSFVTCEKEELGLDETLKDPIPLISPRSQPNMSIQFDIPLSYLVKSHVEWPGSSPISLYQRHPLLTWKCSDTVYNKIVLPATFPFSFMKRNINISQITQFILHQPLPSHRWAQFKKHISKAVHQIDYWFFFKKRIPWNNSFS